MNSLKTVSDSASRIFWMIICLADWAAMRLERLGVEFVLAVAERRCARWPAVDADEHALFDAEVPLGGDLDGGRDPGEDGFARRSSVPRGDSPRV